MVIKNEDYLKILEHLTKKRWEGEEFVAFINDGFPVTKDELWTFSTDSDALKFCLEMTTDIEPYSFLSIRSACRAMQEVFNINRGSVVNVSLMVAGRYERLRKEQLFNNQNSKVMNQKNFEYLRDQVKYTGFGEGLENDLQQKIQEGNLEFNLPYETSYGNDLVKASLNFSRSKQSDTYFFNSYHVSTQKGNEGSNMEQTFYINKGSNITMKEAYNLMEGRSVNKDLANKEGMVYNSWVQLDFKQTDGNGNFKMKHFHQNYGYDLEAALAKHPIKELDNDQYKSNLIDSLKKGNLQSATFQIGGEEKKQFVEANPQFKTVNIYDSNMQRLNSRQSKKEQQSEGQAQQAEKVAKKEKQAPDDGEPEMPKPSVKKKRKQSIS